MKKFSSFTDEEKNRVQAKWPAKVNGSQVIGTRTRHLAGQDRVTKYYLQNGKEAMKKDDGTTVKIFPKSPKRIKKITEE